LVKALLVIAKPEVNAGGVGSAAMMVGAIRKLDDVFAIAPRAKFENERQANDARAMNANEAGGIQPLFKGLDGFAQEMSSSGGMQFRVVPCGGDPFDIIDRNDLNTRAGPNREASGVVAWVFLG